AEQELDSVDCPSVGGASPPATPSHRATARDCEDGKCAARDRGHPLRGPDRQARKARQHDVRQANRCQSVEEAVFEVDVEWHTRAHASHTRKETRLWESSLLRPGFLRIQ